MYELDPSFYGSFYDDLLMVFNGDEQHLRRHWEEYGKKEGRFPNNYVKELYYSHYDYDAYLLYNSDLKHLSEEEARNHWINQGLGQGRRYCHFQVSPLSHRLSNVRRYPYGVNILGYYDDGCGLGENGLSIAKALDMYAIPYEINKGTYGINIITYDLSILPDISPLTEGRVNIGVWAWELEVSCPKRRGLPKLLDEIWTVSEFCKREAGNNAIVVKIPPSCLGCPKSVAESRKEFDIPTELFVCLFVFDFRSSYHRKNPLAVVEAFKRAFKEEQALLIIKANYGSVSSSERQELMSQLPTNCRLIEEEYNKDKVLSLINACDVYMSLHRSEGSGLTMIEAMSMGKPVIATNYSGNLDFMNDSNSLLVDWEYCDLQGYYATLGLNCKWANPNIKTAATYLKMLYNHPELRDKYGKKAKDYIVKEWNRAGLAKFIKNRIDRYYK